MTDNLNESNAVKADTKDENKAHQIWQLNALTAALGDLRLTVSDSLSVGRGSDNDVVLGSKEVSRNHAVLSVLDAKLYVKDLDSSNGTFVNDERIEGNQSVLLRPEDKLGFASFEFQVIAPVAQPTTKADNLPAEEPEDIVGAVQENLETSSVTESAVEPSAPAIDETPAASPAADIESLSAETSEPVVKETIVGEVLAASAGQEAKSAAPVEEDIAAPLTTETQTLPAAATEETLMANDKELHNMDQSATEPGMEKPVVKEPVADTPVIEETIAESPTAQQPITEEPATETKLMHQRAGHEEPVVRPEQDKTTTTALQEEADPEVLRAKQAATAQFSGTANLGQGRDLGTEGNNAMDQAINNPANAGAHKKSASGGWFIWVFIALIIIGLALWLFNMGGA